MGSSLLPGFLPHRSDLAPEKSSMGILSPVSRVVATDMNLAQRRIPINRLSKNMNRLPENKF